MKPDWQDEQFGIALYLGDCLAILPKLPDGCVGAVVADPPYNAAKGYGLGGDRLPDAAYATLMQAVILQTCKLSGKQFWVAPRYQMELWTRLLPGAHMVAIRRGAQGPYRGGWFDQFETALAVGLPVNPTRDLWDDIRLKGEGYFFREDTFGHPGYTPYPILARAVEAFTRVGGLILDPFMGSGTTGVACVKLGRQFIGIEIEPKYFEVSVKRIREAITMQQGGPLFAEHEPAQLELNSVARVR